MTKELKEQYTLDMLTQFLTFYPILSPIKKEYFNTKSIL